MPRRNAGASRNANAAAAGPTVTTTFQMGTGIGAEKPEEKDKPDFWAYMASLSPEQWRDHIVYLTREEPKASITGLGGYLLKTQQYFDIDEIKDAYGGREFSYLMKDKKGSLIYSGKFRIEAPPKFDSARENPNGAAAAVSGSVSVGGDLLKVLEQQNQRLYDVLTTLQGAKEENPAVAGAFDILTEAYKTSVNALATQPPQTPSDSTKTFADAVRLVKELMPPPVPQKTLMEQITELLSNPIIGPTLVDLLKPKNPIDQLTQVGTLLDVAGKLRGEGGGGGKQDWKAEGIHALIERGPDLLDAFAKRSEANLQAAQERRLAEEARLRSIELYSKMSPADREKLSRRVADPQLEVSPTASRAATPAAQPAAAGTPPLTTLRSVAMGDAPQPATAPTEAAAAEISQQDYDDAIKHQIVSMLMLGASPETLVDFLQETKPDICVQIARNSNAVITTFFQNDPVLAQITKDPEWEKVLNTARDYIKECEEEDKTATVN